MAPTLVEKRGSSKIGSREKQCNAGPKAALAETMGYSGVAVTFTVVLRWARGQLRNLALTGHWIWVIS